MNKKIAEEVAILPSKRIRNKVAGFVTVRLLRISDQVCPMWRPQKRNFMLLNACALFDSI